MLKIKCKLTAVLCVRMLGPGNLDMFTSLMTPAPQKSNHLRQPNISIMSTYMYVHVDELRKTPHL